jgi:hypothetical protein
MSQFARDATMQSTVEQGRRIVMLCSTNPRTQLYSLLARLAFDEVDLQLACSLRELPGMADHVPPGVELDEWLADMCVEHHRLFGQNISPYESIFRGRELMFNTATTQRVAAFYQFCGFAPSTRRAVAPDHLGIELALAAVLSARAERSAEAGAQFASLLHEHLVAWLPACAVTIARTARAPLYRLLADVATELVLYDLAEFTPARPRPPAYNGSTDRHIAPLWERRSGNEGADMRQIVRKLLTPAEVGILISRADITVIGHALGLRTPVAGRERMLMGLVGAAGQLDMMRALQDALADLLRAADEIYADLLAAHPAWGTYGCAWRGRVVNGLALLDELADTYQALRTRARAASAVASPTPA